MKGVFCIGELLIDFVGTDLKGLKAGRIFEKKAGGAPGNVVVAIKKLGGNAMFLGQVGNDSFGEFLVEQLEKYNVDTRYIKKEGNTTLAFVSIDKAGERNFEFFRGSDGEYQLDENVLQVINRDSIVHFGSATGFLDSKLKKSYYDLLEYCKANKIFVSFDPNYRDVLIKDDDKVIKEYLYYIENSNFVKLSDEELSLITKSNDLYKSIEMIRKITKAIIVVTLGSKGSLLSYDDKIEIVESISIKQLDSTGAGDAFVGGVLFKILGKDNYMSINFTEYKEFVRFGNKIGAKTCEKFGAMESIPTKLELDEL